MIREKKCVYCRRTFTPHAFHIRRQRACPQPECQKQRRRDYNRAYYRDNRADWDYRWEQRKAWRQKCLRDYMRRYRKDHADYVKQNRRQQRRRDRKKANLVNSVVRGSIHAWKLMRIHVLESSCKFRRIRLLPDGNHG